MSSCLIVGATGLCGSFIVKHAPEFYTKAYTISRSEPEFAQADKVETILEKDSTTWAAKVKEIKEKDPQCTTFFSGLGTTRGKAGGIANQYKIDHDLNLELAKAAKEAGFQKYILISSAKASADSRLPYLKMKGELDDAVIKLGFDQTIILRPGALLGERKEGKGFGNTIVSKLGGFLKGTAVGNALLAPIDGEEVAMSALKEATKQSDQKVVILEALEVNKSAAQ